MIIPGSLALFLDEHNPLAVAVSGGTDSMALLASCLDAGIDAIAVFAETGLNPAGERERVSELCRRISVDLTVINCDMLKQPEVMNNSPERCYACKHLMMSSVISAALEAGIEHVADGTNTDDTTGDRPGLKALHELGVLSPFAECGIGRAGVERIASDLGTGVMPQSSCIATRFPEDTILDPAMIRMVRSGEALLRRAGVKGILRLRCVDHGSGVIECESPWRVKVKGCRDSLLELGFKSVSINPCGYGEGGSESWKS